MSVFYKILFFVIQYTIESVAFYFLFDKAGEKNYKGLIPVYRYYILYKLTWHSAYFYPYIVLKIVMQILNYYVDILIGYEKITFALIPFSVVLLAVGIVTLLLEIMQKIKMGKAFSRKNGFIVGLILLPHIFLFILAFSKKSVYIGPQDEEDSDHS